MYFNNYQCLANSFSLLALPRYFYCIFTVKLFLFFVILLYSYCLCSYSCLHPPHHLLPTSTRPLPPLLSVSHHTVSMGYAYTFFG